MFSLVQGLAMSDRIRKAVLLSVFATAMLVLLCPQGAFSQTYTPQCQVPPQIAFSTDPNLLLLMDFSGSMQEQTYYGLPATMTACTSNCSRCSCGCCWTYGSSQVLDEDSTDSTSGMSAVNAAAYDPTNQTTYSPYYYGLFDNTQYYKYDDGSDPTNPCGIPGGGYFYPIGSTTPTGTTPNIGSVQAGLSGAVLNWAVTCRIDAALQALIGGKTYDSTDTNATGFDSNNNELNCTDASGSCYKTAQGARRSVYETNKLWARFYIRPATWTQAAPGGVNVDYPNDYSSATGTQTDPSYSQKDLVISIRGIYKGALTKGKSGISNNNYYDAWTFTLTQTTNVDISLTGTWTPSSNVQLRVSTSSNPTQTTLKTVSGSPARAQLQLPGASGGTTYYVYAFDMNSKEATGTYQITSNVNLSPASSNNAGQTNSSIGSIPYPRVRIKIAPTDLDNQGVVRKSWTQGRFGFMYYKGDTDDHKGKLLAYCGQYTDMHQFIRTIQGETPEDQGDPPGSLYQQPWPYSGTPTGEAFGEVINYLEQNGNGINSGLMNYQHAPNDPYYAVVGGVQKAVSCRQTYVIHLTDGNWYDNSGSTVDPVPNVWTLHAGANNGKGLRTDVSGSGGTPIFANIFAIFCFASTSDPDYNYGVNSLQWEAMFGGFNALPNCTPSNYPWPMTGTSFNSATKTFSISQCPTSSSPNKPCCEEWDLGTTVCTSNFTSGCKGVPDHFFNASNGELIEQALQNILTNITQQTAASSAVATVAQQSAEGDLIIRGAFEARAPSTDTADACRFLWFGHLESYWPDKKRKL